MVNAPEFGPLMQSPRWVGNEKFVISVESLSSYLQGRASIVTFNLVFEASYPRFPRLGFSWSSYKNLIKQNRLAGAPDNCPLMKMHEWSPAYDLEWSRLSVAGGDVVEILLHTVEKGTVDVRFDFKGRKSATYTYDLSPTDHDIYFVLGVPQREMENKNVMWLTLRDYGNYVLDKHMEADNRQAAIQAEVPTCTICFDELDGSDGKVVTELQCKHAFHQQCIDSWRRTSPTGGCPVCRH
ncbi:ETP1-like protein [Aphelenchoides avenae]|nr:ETP1-like protein [Aphelenchus avenae]